MIQEARRAFDYITQNCGNFELDKHSIYCQNHMACEISREASILIDEIQLNSLTRRKISKARSKAELPPKGIK